MRNGKIRPAGCHPQAVSTFVGERTATDMSRYASMTPRVIQRVRSNVPGAVTRSKQARALGHGDLVCHATIGHRILNLCRHSCLPLLAEPMFRSRASTGPAAATCRVPHGAGQAGNRGRGIASNVLFRMQMALTHFLRRARASHGECGGLEDARGEVISTWVERERRSGLGLRPAGRRKVDDAKPNLRKGIWPPGLPLCSMPALRGMPSAISLCAGRSGAFGNR